MDIAVFGASGRTGRQVVRQGLERGHEITAFVRGASRIGMSNDLLQVVEGDARDGDAVGGAVRGADAIVSVLALMRPEDEPQYSEATAAIVEAAKREGVRRIAVTANNDVFGDNEVTGEFAPHAREHRRNREALKASTLDWTIVAAGWVVDEEGMGTYQASLDEKAAKRKIGPQDLATAVLDAVEHDEWIGHIVGVSDAT